jgi:hypothetical protein
VAEVFLVMGLRAVTTLPDTCDRSSAMTSPATRRCSSECSKITERYCVPTSLPCRLSCVGSWITKNTSRISRYAMRAGSNSIRTTSAWPVRPPQTCS